MNGWCLRVANLAAVVLALSGVSVAAADESEEGERRHAKTLTVDCMSGDSLARALARAEERKLTLIVIRNICIESVTVDRSDVTLRGDPASGGGISGPDPNVNTLTVTGDRVTIENLTVTGGRNGIVGLGAAGLTIRNAAVQSTGRNGIVYLNGSSGQVEGCNVRLNPRDGINVEAAQATILNSTVESNGRFGVHVTNGGSARIGLNNRNEGNHDGPTRTGNTIKNNGASGINVGFGSAAIIAVNDITGNGADLSTASGRNGIAVVQATADIAGSNTISGNTGQGILARSSSVQLGNPNFNFSTTNTITNNGDAASPGGIFAFLGSAMLIRDAVINENKGPGLAFSTRSHGQLFSSAIQNNRTIGVCAPFPALPCNAGDAVRLIFGSGLLVSAPNTVVSGNAGWGLQCTDAESSVVNTGLLSLSANALGGVSGSCTGF
jgi:hypothetical protein